MRLQSTIGLPTWVNTGTDPEPSQPSDAGIQISP